MKTSIENINELLKRLDWAHAANPIEVTLSRDRKKLIIRGEFPKINSLFTVEVKENQSKLEIKSVPKESVK